jgi:hypothetical protein
MGNNNLCICEHAAKPDLPCICGAAVTPSREQLATVWAAAAYLYNCSPQKLAEALFPGRHPTYLSEWATRFERGVGRRAA